jgi:hypothetical protein
MAKPASVYLELGPKKVFACAVDWPGWCRVGKTEEAALELLAETAPRFAVIAKEAGVRFSGPTSFTVVERVKGSATTDFGAPGAIADVDRAPVSKRQAERLAVWVDAAWRVFDRVAASSPAKLRKGPRGGGRDRDKMIDHVAAAQKAYAGKLGLPPGSRGRTDILDALRAADPDTAWPPRYAARRIAWHVVDHIWEMEDRATF